MKDKGLELILAYQAIAKQYAEAEVGADGVLYAKLQDAWVAMRTHYGLEVVA